MAERYHRVYQRGYEAGLAEATSALRAFMEGGGQIVQGSGWSSYAFTVRHQNGTIAEIPSLGALRPFQATAERERRPERWEVEAMVAYSTDTED